jgi:hypothetical protein
VTRLYKADSAPTGSMSRVGFAHDRAMFGDNGAETYPTMS